MIARRAPRRRVGRRDVAWRRYRHARDQGRERRRRQGDDVAQLDGSLGRKTEASTQRLTRRMALLEIQAREMDAALSRSQSTLGKLVSAMGLTEKPRRGLGHAFSVLSVASAIGFVGHKTIEETTRAGRDGAARGGGRSRPAGGWPDRVATRCAVHRAPEADDLLGRGGEERAERCSSPSTRSAGTNFDRATQAVTDLATRMGGDLPEARRCRSARRCRTPSTGLTALRGRACRSRRRRSR
jgi:hypothetical protein